MQRIVTRLNKNAGHITLARTISSFAALVCSRCGNLGRELAALSGVMKRGEATFAELEEMREDLKASNEYNCVSLSGASLRVRAGTLAGNPRKRLPRALAASGRRSKLVQQGATFGPADSDCIPGGVRRVVTVAAAASSSSATAAFLRVVCTPSPFPFPRYRFALLRLMIGVRSCSCLGERSKSGSIGQTARFRGKCTGCPTGAGGVMSGGGVADGMWSKAVWMDPLLHNTRGSIVPDRFERTARRTLSKKTYATRHAL